MKLFDALPGEGRPPLPPPPPSRLELLAPGCLVRYGRPPIALSVRLVTIGA